MPGGMTVWEVPVGERSVPYVEGAPSAEEKLSREARARTSWLKSDLSEHLRGQGFLVWEEVACVAFSVESSAGRMDVYAMKPQYGERWSAAYEVKLTRADFLQDRNSGKYEKYRSQARRFYYAVPRGLVKLSEVPDECGLISRGPNGWRHIRHPKPNERFEPSTEFMLMLMRRHFKHEGEVRDLKMRATFESNYPLSVQAHRLGREIARKLAMFERGVGKDGDERERYQVERAVAFMAAVDEMLEQEFGFARDNVYGGMDVERKLVFVKAMIREAVRLQKVGQYLTRLPHVVGEEIEALLRSK